jgi:endoglucanase
MAAALGREQQFDAIWRWTKRNVMRPDALLAFRWADGRIQDPQAAADADLDTVRALLIGACRFDRPQLQGTARRIGKAVLRRETADAAGRPVLLAGPWAAADGRLTTNPSYVDPVTLTALANELSDRRYTALATEGRRIIRSVSAPLPPDWAVVDTASGRARPVASASTVGGEGRFAWDAARTLVRLAVDPEAAGRRIAPPRHARCRSGRRDGLEQSATRPATSRRSGSARPRTAVVLRRRLGGARPATPDHPSARSNPLLMPHRREWVQAASS